MSVNKTTLFTGEVMGSNLVLENNYTDYMLVDPGFDSRQGRRFFLVQNVQTGSGANSPSCQMGIGGSSHWGKRPGREVIQLHVLPSLRMGGAIHLLPYMPSWRRNCHLSH
jgi:hypothetical protein